MDRIERAAEWTYPAPLLVVLALSTAILGGCYIRERKRKRPRTMRDVSVEQKAAREAWKAEARRNIALIKGEIAGNRRRAEGDWREGDAADNGD